jgi:hypothetical protein
MAYCAIADVQRLNPKRVYDASSTPTSTQVTALIDQVAAEIDTVLLSRGLSVPVTIPTEFVTHLKQVNATGAAALAEMGMFPESAGVISTPQGERLWRIYTGMIEYLKKGDLPVDTQPGEPRSFFTEHTEEPEPDEAWRRSKFGKEF